MFDVYQKIFENDDVDGWFDFYDWCNGVVKDQVEQVNYGVQNIELV